MIGGLWICVILEKEEEEKQSDCASNTQSVLPFFQNRLLYHLVPLLSPSSQPEGCDVYVHWSWPAPAYLAVRTGSIWPRWSLVLMRRGLGTPGTGLCSRPSTAVNEKKKNNTNSSRGYRRPSYDDRAKTLRDQKVESNWSPQGVEICSWVMIRLQCVFAPVFVQAEMLSGVCGTFE